MVKRVEKNGAWELKEDDARVVVRTTCTLRDAFVKTCKEQDTDASKELRKYMRDYIKRHGQKKLSF